MSFTFNRLNCSMHAKCCSYVCDIIDHAFDTYNYHRAIWQNGHLQQGRNKSYPCCLVLILLNWVSNICVVFGSVQSVKQHLPTALKF